MARLEPLAGQAQFGLTLRASVTLAALALLTVSVVSNSGTRVVAPAMLAVVTIAVARNHLGRFFEWRSLLALTILVILFIPIRRYTLPASLPFHLEPYRVVVAFVIVAWLCSLLIDPRVRLRRTGLEGPLLAFGAAVLISLISNLHRVSSVGPVLNKELVFFASFLLLVFLIGSIVTRVRDIDLLTKVLVAGGAVVALTAVIESRTGYNVFDHLSHFMPFLHFEGSPFQGHDLTGATRGGRPRAYASAQHPIALGAAFVMLLPFALYLARKTRRPLWWIASVLLLFGEFASVSRTGILMLVVMVFVYALRNPASLKQIAIGFVPAVLVVHLAVPGTTGTVVGAFFPKGGLIAQQTNQNVGSGRLATLGPVLHKEFAPDPIFGEGFGTRIIETDGSVQKNAPILDDEWAGVLVETGVVGALAFAWIFVRVLRNWRRVAKQDDSPRGWFMTAAMLSVASYGVGMFTFDAFSFIQVTFLFFIILGLGASAYQELGRVLATENLPSPRGRRMRTAPGSEPAR